MFHSTILSIIFIISHTYIQCIDDYHCSFSIQYHTTLHIPVGIPAEFGIPFQFTKKISELAISFRRNLESESIGNLMYGPEPQNLQLIDISTESYICNFELNTVIRTHYQLLRMRISWYKISILDLLNDIVNFMPDIKVLSNG